LREQKIALQTNALLKIKLVELKKRYAAQIGIEINRRLFEP
jgi:hypothetical protein